MAMECLNFLCGDIDEISVDSLDSETIENLGTWFYNGGKTTLFVN